MTILDIIAFGGSMASILGIFLYFYQRNNNKLMKELVKNLGDKMDEGFRKMDEGFRKMDEMAKQRHDDVIKLLEKGFGDLSRAKT
jgi:hypothetical protein